MTVHNRSLFGTKIVPFLYLLPISIVSDMLLFVTSLFDPGG